MKTKNSLKLKKHNKHYKGKNSKSLWVKRGKKNQRSVKG